MLEQLTAKLRNKDNSDKYVVLHYNCWQYDFYEEPLIAILTAMIDAIEPESTRLNKERASTALNSLMDTLIRVGKHYVFSRYGLDLTDLFHTVSTIAEKNAQAMELAQNRMSFDPNYSLKKSIEDVRKSLEEYADKKTLVIIVDELDRCLPEYAIKVMERLHHLFFGLPNTAVILGIDKKQLTQSIKQIFGIENETDDYLRKIILFEITLDAGVVTDKLPIKYKAYFELFNQQALAELFPPENGIFHHGFDCVEFITNLLHGITIRRQEQLINHCMTVHKLLFGTEKKDYSFLCAELFWIVLTEEYGYTEMPIRLQYTTVDGRQKRWFCVDDVDVNTPPEERSPEALNRTAFKNNFDTYLLDARIDAKSPVPGYDRNGHDLLVCYFEHCIGIGELLIWYLSRMFKPHDETYSLKKYEKNTPYVPQLRNLRTRNIHDLEKFKDTLRIIK